MPIFKNISPWDKHRIKWKGCQACSLCKNRLHIVLARGQIPCDVLFVGEAPGASEDVIGQPFVGPAGRLLDQIVERGINDARPIDPATRLRSAFTNIVCCLPTNESIPGKLPEPPVESIKACAPRLAELVAMCRPRLIVTVGKLSDRWTPIATQKLDLGELKIKPPKWASIIHPAAILRMLPAQQGLAVQRAVVTLEDAVADLK
jgi:DNA polymerase